MTREEAITELKYARAMTEFDPMTGEVGFRNDEDKRQAEAFDMAIKLLDQQSPEDWRDVPSYEMTLEQARQTVRDLRKKLAEYLEQEPKTGHWIDIMVGDMPAQACDQCNTFYPLAYTGGGHKYCPNCGVKMQEAESEEDGLDSMLENLWNATESEDAE